MKTRLSICRRKVSYRSEKEALFAAQASGLIVRPYRCERCRLFHLTSRTKGKRVRRPVDQGSGACERADPRLARVADDMQPPVIPGLSFGATNSNIKFNNQIGLTPFEVDFLGGELVVTSGAATGKKLPLARIVGDVAALGIADASVATLIKPGDAVRV